MLSIVMPVYNRAAFLPTALQSIRDQQYEDWELIVVDDGSTDDTHEHLASLMANCPCPVRYIYQENQGPAAARNRGVDAAAGEYIAFFDSDDIWLSHHLSRCVAALEAQPDADWVFSSAYVENLTNGDLVRDKPYHVNGRPRKFLHLPVYERQGAKVIDYPHLCWFALRHGFETGLQCAVYRRRVFRDGFRLPNFRVGEDQIFVVLALKRGFRPAYVEDISAIYRRHDGNASNANTVKHLSRRIEVIKEFIRAFESLDQYDLDRCERLALNRRLAELYVWKLGYALLWENGQSHEALAAFRQGIRRWPWSVSFWKVYLVCLLKAGLRKQKSATDELI